MVGPLRTWQPMLRASHSKWRRVTPLCPLMQMELLRPPRYSGGNPWEWASALSVHLRPLPRLLTRQ